MYKASHLARAHGQALKDQSRMSLVLLSNHEILLRNTNTIETGLADKIQKLQNKPARLSLFLFTRYSVRSNALLDALGWERLETSRLK